MDTTTPTPGANLSREIASRKNGAANTTRWSIGFSDDEQHDALIWAQPILHESELFVPPISRHQKADPIELRLNFPLFENLNPGKTPTAAGPSKTASW